MNRKLKIFFYFLGICFLFFLVSRILIFVMNLPLEEKILFQTCQSPLVYYDQFDPYCLSVINQSRLSGDRLYIFVGRGKEAPDYGHEFPFRFYKDYSEDLNQHISRSMVQWNGEGVIFESGSGHKLFIPKKMFIGGR